MSGAVVLGGGFVGAAVAAALSESVDVIVVDAPTHPGLFDRTEASRSAVLDACDGVGASVVVNACGRLRGTADELTDANVAWPQWLVDVLGETGVRFVHIGSAAEYGDPGSADPIPETRTTAARGDYAESKAAGSLAVLDARAAGMDATVARVFNLVGPALSAASPLHQFLTDVTALPANGGTIELWWPDTRRDFLLLDDMAEVIAALAVHERTVDVVNICSGVGVSFGEIAAAMAERQGKALEIRSLERPGIPCVVGDPTLLHDLTGLRPTITPELIAAHATLQTPSTPEEG